MTTLSIADYLKFANLQMAAEAFYEFDPRLAASLTPGATKPYESIEARHLTMGNNHSSKFTATEATKFAADWAIVEHKSNTSTGFSGTLFRNKDSGELVLSFRSTEFIDDAARDNKATNEMEIKDYGWAFGQLDDMEAWYQSLQSRNLIDRQISVTGYSLGGHLATAFNLLHNADTLPDFQPLIDRVVTFNGAGVGKVTGGISALAGVLADFRRLRENVSGTEIQFDDPRLNDVYAVLRERISSGNWPSDADYALLDSVFADSSGSEFEQQSFAYDKGQIKTAMDRVQRIAIEVGRLVSVSDSQQGSPAPIPTSQIAQMSLDYQMAVLAMRTRAIPRGYAGGLINLLFGKEPGTPLLSNQTDVVGQTWPTSPSMVAESQWHHGSDARVFIENQPLHRGTILRDVLGDIFSFKTPDLLRSQYSQNDFGDTHSLVLLVDSLNVQNALLQLVPESQRDSAATTLNDILRQASWRKAESIGGQQGKAEGDVLENVLNALADLLLGPDSTRVRLNGSPDGATWAEIDDLPAGDYTGRKTFYERLQAIVASRPFSELAGRLTLQASSPSLAQEARTDFGAFAALYSLSPFVLKRAAGVAQSALDAAFLVVANGTLFQDWIQDRENIAAGRSASNISDAWLGDRAAALTAGNAGQWTNARFAEIKGTKNWRYADLDSGQRYFGFATADALGRARVANADPSLLDTAFETEYALGRGTLVTFGKNTPRIPGESADDAGEDALQGGDFEDHLYGMAGSDKLQGNGGKDLLDGGAGNDQLEGGAGRDTYVVGLGIGTIDDAEGIGIVEGMSGKTLAGQYVGNDGSYVRDGDGGPITASFAGTTLTLTLAGNATVVINNYDEAAATFGISIADKPKNPSLILGTSDSDDGWTEIESPDGTLSQIAALRGTPGDNEIDFLAGDDYAFGDAGNDEMDGGQDRDRLLGGNCDDVVIGGSGVDFLEGQNNDDRVFAEQEKSFDEAIADEDASPIAEIGDFLDGDQLPSHEELKGGLDGDTWTEINVFDSPALYRANAANGDTALLERLAA